MTWTWNFCPSLILVRASSRGKWNRVVLTLVLIKFVVFLNSFQVSLPRLSVVRVWTVHENVATEAHGRLAQTTLSVSCRTGLTFARQLLIHLEKKTSTFWSQTKCSNNCVFAVGLYDNRMKYKWPCSGKSRKGSLQHAYPLLSLQTYWKMCALWLLSLNLFDSSSYNTHAFYEVRGFEGENLLVSPNFTSLWVINSW